MTTTDAAPSSRRDRNKLRTRMRILEAARRHFTEKGVDGTTIGDVSDQADVARATFFNYFPTKAAVVSALLREQDADFSSLLMHSLEKDIPTEALLKEVFTASAKTIEKSSQYYRVMIAESERVGLEEDDRYANMISLFRKVIDAGLARGDVRSDYSADLLAELVVGAYAIVLRSWRVKPGYELTVRLTETARMMSDFLAAPSAARGDASKINRGCDLKLAEQRKAR